MRLAIFCYPGALRMAVEGIRETLGLANQYGGQTYFCVRVFEEPGRQRREIARFFAGDGTSLVVVPPGELAALTALVSDEFAGELRRQHERGRTVAAICTGNFALAAANLLNGRAATTHWGLAQSFRTRFPSIPLELERILIDHRDVVSVGGLTAFLDFCLWLIAREAGRGLALLVARILQVAPERQSQLPWMELAPPVHLDDPAVNALVEALDQRPHHPWNMKRMAKIAGCTSRTLERHFRSAMGTSPARFLQEKRLALARRRLEEGASVEEACEGCGWSDLSSFVRLFKRRTGFTPARYRAWTRAGGEGKRLSAPSSPRAQSDRARGRRASRAAP